MTKELAGITIALCQMKVVPGRPDLNTAYIVEEIRKAQERGVGLIVFPEMATTGYFIGDLYEDEAFLRDVADLNGEIRKATAGGITAIVGTPVLVPGHTGEDGRERLLNAAVIYAAGRYVGHVAKTLQPNYRMFHDDRHFFSTRKMALEEGKQPSELLEPLTLSLKSGRTIQAGVILCEDMWHETYALNPAKILTEKGAEILVNISASPWTWQKNRKRHQVVRRLAETCRVPMVYVNNVGIQNTGKNIIVFDGSSTAYNAAGEAVFEISPHADGTRDMVLAENMPVLPAARQDDSKELYEAVRAAVREFFAMLPPNRRKVLVGLSGGIDSSCSAAIYVDALGAENVIGITMPSKYNSDKTQNLARAVATNLGISFEARPIQGIVDAIAKSTGITEGGLAYENIQARTRMEVLAARAQDLNCVFSANWNKVEAAFGYGTLYGDMAGAIAVLGDMVKREVYQLADYLNREVFRRDVIPQECFDMAPTAELRENQRDPFDYGKISRRGYHDEMVRAFTEFRRNPEWFLEMYRRGLLEKELLLDAGSLKALFPTTRHFIQDLEKRWRMFFGAYFKRIQGPPIPIVSKRAFGMDLYESLLSPYFTEVYYELRAEILSREPARVAIFGLSANPPHMSHRRVVGQLLGWFDEVVVVPCGNRDEKDTLKDTPLEARKEMTRLTFGDLPNVRIDAYDLDNDTYTPTYALDERYRKLFPGKEIWHAVGGDLVTGGRDGKAEIQRSWRKKEEVWQTVNFVVMARPGFTVVPEDLPPNADILEFEELIGSSTLVRERIAKGEDVRPLLAPGVYEYIEAQGLYRVPKGGA